MPFVNGVWVPEDDSVTTQVAAITAQDSPLMKQAATRGAQLANRRGLLNSSIASQAAQEAVIGAAAPIAGQNASQIAAKNLGKINNDAQAGLQKDAIAAQDRANLLQAGITANGQYLDAFGQIAGNKDIPAASRDAYLSSILAARNAPAGLAKGIYGVDLNWGDGTQPITPFGVIPQGGGGGVGGGGGLLR